MHSKRSLFCWYGVYALTFAFFLLGNFLTPYLCDDYCLVAMREAPFTVLLECAFQKSWLMWNTWGGSVVPSFSVTVFMNYHKFIFNIANALLATALLRVMFGLVQSHEGKRSLIAYLLLVSLFLVFVPVPGQTLFWVSGSVTYLWPLLMSVLFLYPYCITTEGPRSWQVKGLECLTPVTGLLAGNAHGALSGVVFVASFLLTLLIQRENKRLPWWTYTGVLFSLIGCVLYVSAPGNYLRLGVIEHETIPLIVHQLYSLLKVQGVLGVVLVLALVLCFLHRDKQAEGVVCRAFILAGCSLLGMCSLLIVPAAERASLFFPCLASISLMILVSNVPESRIIRHLKLCLLVLLVSQVAFTYSLLYFDAFRCKRIIDQRSAYMRAEVAKGNKVLIVPNLTQYAVYRRFTGGLSDLQESPAAWENMGQANYFGADQVIGTPYKAGSAGLSQD